MARPTTTASGQPKVRAAVRLDPVLKEWAKTQGINLSEALEAKLLELRSASTRISMPPDPIAFAPQPGLTMISYPEPSAGKDVPF